MRRCIGCCQSKPQSDMLRFTYDGRVFRADAEGCRSDGRGIYLCRDDQCIEKSFRRKAWNRIARSSVDTEEIREAIESAFTCN